MELHLHSGAVSLGYETFSVGDASFSEGSRTAAIGQGSHAEGSSDTSVSPLAIGYRITEVGTSMQLVFSTEDVKVGSIVRIEIESIGEAVDSELCIVSSVEYGDPTVITVREFDSDQDRVFTQTGEFSMYLMRGLTSAQGEGSHSEGSGTSALGNRSHAQGYYTRAVGDNSHTGGSGTVANSLSQTVIGENNIIDAEGTPSTRGEYAFIIGNGASSNDRSNAFAVKWDGSIVFNDGTFIYADELSRLVDILAQEPCIIDVSHVDRSSVGETKLAPPIAGEAIAGESILGGTSSDTPSVGGKFIINEVVSSKNGLEIRKLDKTWQQISDAFNKGLNCIINKSSQGVIIDGMDSTELYRKAVLDVGVESPNAHAEYNIYVVNTFNQSYFCGSPDSNPSLDGRELILDM